MDCREQHAVSAPWRLTTEEEEKEEKKDVRVVMLRAASELGSAEWQQSSW